MALTRTLREDQLLCSIDKILILYHVLDEWPLLGNRLEREHLGVSIAEE